MGIKREDFKMESQLDTIGEHFVHVTYHSEQYNKAGARRGVEKSARRSSL